jgi:hypothetical protein
MSLLSFCQWLQDGEISTGIRESIWLFPIVETTHVLALSVSVGLLVWFDFRLLGFGIHQPVSRVHKQIMPWTLAGFVVMFISGVLLTWSEPVKCISSGFFIAKIFFVGLAGVNATVFEWNNRHTIEEWDNLPVLPRRARVAGVLSLVSWFAVITAGRAMAYNLF